MIEVNVRGFSRGVPTVRTQKAMKKNPGETLLVLVDTAWAKEDITRLGEICGYSVNSTKTPNGYDIVLTPERASSKPAA